MSTDKSELHKATFLNITEELATMLRTSKRKGMPKPECIETFCNELDKAIHSCNLDRIRELLPTTLGNGWKAKLGQSHFLWNLVTGALRLRQYEFAFQIVHMYDLYQEPLLDTEIEPLHSDYAHKKHIWEWIADQQNPKYAFIFKQMIATVMWKDEFDVLYTLKNRNAYTRGVMWNALMDVFCQGHKGHLHDVMPKIVSSFWDTVTPQEFEDFLFWYTRAEKHEISNICYKSTPTTVHFILDKCTFALSEVSLTNCYDHFRLREYITNKLKEVVPKV